MPVGANVIQELSGEIAEEDNIVKIRVAFQLLHEQAVAVKPARKRAAEKVAPVAQDIHGLAWQEEDGRIVIIASTQAPFRDRWEIGNALGMDMNRLRVVSPYLGGAFGGKDGATIQCFLALVAMHAEGRSVKMWWDREENFAAGYKRHAVRMLYRLGAGTDGSMAVFTTIPAPMRIWAVKSWLWEWSMPEGRIVFRVRSSKDGAFTPTTPLPARCADSVSRRLLLQ